MTAALHHFLPTKAVVVGIFAFVLLSSCVSAPTERQFNFSTAGVPPEYRQRADGKYTIPAVNPAYLTKNNRRSLVSYNGPEKPGTIVVDPYARVLYHIVKPGLAMRFGVAVGRVGLGFSGTAIVGRKATYPRWTPTSKMISDNPKLYGPVIKGVDGGINNPLGARALYLYRNGTDTFYRIHGTMDPSSIGRATSAGCIRLFNQDIIDLFNVVPLGTKVIVRTEEESLKFEGIMLIERKTGYAFPSGVVGPARRF